MISAHVTEHLGRPGPLHHLGGVQNAVGRERSGHQVFTILELDTRDYNRAP
jgi:hypothetical protein